MALEVQTDAGDNTDATSYLSVADFKAYHTARGNAYSGYTDAQIEQALTRATDHIDLAFSFYGYPVNGRSQSTKWPRYDVYDADENYVEGLPKEIVDATAEYAFRALSATLAPDSTQSATGYPIKSTTQKVDVIEESIEYDTTRPTALPAYPAVDNRIYNACLAYRVGIPTSGDLALG